MTKLTNQEHNRNQLGCTEYPDTELVHTMDDEGTPRITAPDFARSWSDLMPKEREILRFIDTVDQMTSLVLVDKWIDDHVACWGLRINGIGLGLWWYDDYIGREAEMQDPPSVLDHLIDIRTREQVSTLLQG